MVTRRFVALAGAALLATMATNAYGAAQIDLELRPSVQVACVDEEVQIDLVAVSPLNPECPFAGLQVILDWNPLDLQLIGDSTAASPVNWADARFLPNDLFGLNEAVPPQDGDGYYIALGQLGGNAPVATPSGLIVTTFTFKALREVNLTSVELLQEGGNPIVRSRVVDAFIPGLTIPGNLLGADVAITCIRTLANLRVEGDNQVPAGTTSPCQAIATFTTNIPNFSFDVDVSNRATWVKLSGPGTLDPNNGLYTAPLTVAQNTTVQVRATFTDDGTTLMATKTFTVTPVGPPRTPNALALGGLIALDEGTMGQCTATAIFDDAPNADVTNFSLWQITDVDPPGSPQGTINATGKYTAPADVQQDILVTIQATFTENNVTVMAEKIILVRDTGVTIPNLVNVTIFGSNTVNENTMVNYTAIATFDDNSQRDVTDEATWAIVGPGTIQSAGDADPGKYTAPAVAGGAVNVVINATFTDNAITRTGTLTITVIEPPVVVNLVLEPANQMATVGDEVKIQLRAVSNVEFSQEFASVEAVLGWDPNVLKLLGAQNPTPNPFTPSTFPANDLHRLNERVPPQDGNGLWIGIASQPVTAPAAGNPGVLLTTFCFEVVGPGVGFFEIRLRDGLMIGTPPRQQETNIRDFFIGANIRGMLGSAIVTTTGGGGGGPGQPIVVNRTPADQSVSNRTTPITEVVIQFDRNVAVTNFQVVGRNNGNRGGTILGNNTPTVRFALNLPLPDRDTYDVTLTANGTLFTWTFSRLIGDCDRNRVVNIFDLGRVRNALRTGTPDPDCDIVPNGVIDIFDLGQIRIAVQNAATAPAP